MILPAAPAMGLKGGGVMGEAVAMLTMPETAAMLRVDVSTVSRWASRGYRRSDGEVVRLWSQKAGKRWLTTQAAVDAFVAACDDRRGSVDANGTDAETGSETPNRGGVARGRLERMRGGVAA